MRMFKPGAMLDNNLLFAPMDGYNYDRPRRRGEGNDWNET